MTMRAVQRHAARQRRTLSPVTDVPNDRLQLLVDALLDLTAAASVEAVAETTVAAARTMSSARGAALGLISPNATAVELLASTGYDCDTMGPGARLALDSGLPLAESVRTRRTVVTGGSGGWAAVPVEVDDTTYGALLVSLAGEPADLTALDSLALAAGGALRRARAMDRLVAHSTAVAQALAPPPLATPGWLDASSRLLPAEGDVGGDVVLALSDGPDSCWLVVADVCGSGAVAAVLGAGLRPIVSAVAQRVASPADLLEALDGVLSRDSDSGRFVTAAVARLERGSDGVTGRLAVAGHPLPLLCRNGSVTALGTPATPLNLRLGTPAPRPVDVPVLLRRGDTLLLHTDGLVDRLGSADGGDALLALFARAGRLDDAAATAEALLGALDATTGPARDDLALLVVRAAG